MLLQFNTDEFCTALNIISRSTKSPYKLIRIYCRDNLLHLQYEDAYINNIVKLILSKIQAEDFELVIEFKLINEFLKNLNESSFYFKYDKEKNTLVLSNKSKKSKLAISVFDSEFLYKSIDDIEKQDQIYKASYIKQNFKYTKNYLSNEDKFDSVMYLPSKGYTLSDGKGYEVKIDGFIMASDGYKIIKYPLYKFISEDVSFSLQAIEAILSLNNEFDYYCEYSNNHINFSNDFHQLLIKTINEIDYDFYDSLDTWMHRDVDFKCVLNSEEILKSLNFAYSILGDKTITLLAKDNEIKLIGNNDGIAFSQTFSIKDPNKDLESSYNIKFLIEMFSLFESADVDLYAWPLQEGHSVLQANKDGLAISIFPSENV